MTRNVLDTAITKYEREFNISETVKLITNSGPIFFSWGVSKFFYLSNKGLLFKVNGNHHKGYVLITLAWNDTYNVYIMSTHGNVKTELNEVYYDMLVDVIDNEIEYVEDYKF